MQNKVISIIKTNKFYFNTLQSGLSRRNIKYVLRPQSCHDSSGPIHVSSGPIKRYNR